MDCKYVEENVSLYIYQELPVAEQHAVEEHASVCERCRKTVEESRRLHALLSRREAAEVPPELLVRSRLKLEEALDAEQLGWRRLMADWFPLLPGARPSRAAAVVVLVMLGFGLGWILRPRAARTPSTQSSSPQHVSSAGLDLGRISSISQVLPDPQTGQVRITLNADRHVTLEGSLDDPRIRQILVEAVKSYNNPGIRLDTLNALKPGSNNPSVQDALLYAFQQDPNAGVRLQALKYVREMNWSDKVQKALVDAAREDKNPGVRVASIDALVSHAVSQRDTAVAPILEKFAEHDTNNYVRLKALAAVHELEQGR